MYFEAKTLRARSLAWLPGPDGEAVSRYNGMTVYPSDIGAQSESADMVRTEKVGLYTVESYLILEKRGTDLAVAFPTSETRVVQLPGVKKPIEICWEANERRGGVIYKIKLEEIGVTIPSFPGPRDRERFEKLSPQVLQSAPWDEYPNADVRAECFVGYEYTADDKLIGQAYPYHEVVIEPETAGIYRLSDGTVLVPGAGANVTAWLDNDGTYVFEVQVGTILKLPI